MRLWHGGVPGLKPGDLIVPGERHYVDGCAVCEAKRRGETYRTVEGGAVDVELLGDAQESTEDPFQTWHAPSARVLSVEERAVRLTPAQRRTLLNRWRRADERSGPLLGLVSIPRPSVEMGKLFG